MDDSGHIAWWVVGGIAGGIGGFAAYAITHRDTFDWREAALWTAGGAVIGGTLGAGAQWVAGALGAEAAATAGAAAATGERTLLNATTWQQAEQMLGEHLGIAKNTYNFFVKGMSQARRPDFINLAQGYIADAKFWNVPLTQTAQVKDFVVLANEWGVKLYIYVRQGTPVSKDVLKLIQSTGGDIIRIFE